MDKSGANAATGWRVHLWTLHKGGAWTLWFGPSIAASDGSFSERTAQARRSSASPTNTKKRVTISYGTRSPPTWTRYC
jgi:hypothetical protein